MTAINTMKFQLPGLYIQANMQIIGLKTPSHVVLWESCESLLILPSLNDASSKARVHPPPWPRKGILSCKQKNSFLFVR